MSFENKTLLITGGTGSFGSTVLTHFLDTNIKEVRIFSRDEKKQEDLRVKYKNSKLNFIIGDVRDYGSINMAMRGVDYVFQAAALKQVPSCEFYPMQAVKTNILGSENVLEAAAANDVEKVIVLSTDKAVYPINTMGMSKAIMEKLAISKSRDPRMKARAGVICATRYGNVMASRGSIIPLLIKQIKESRELTLTDPNMTRFMMSLDESVKLVMFAFLNASSGDIFVQKAPAATIKTLADALVALFNSSSKISIIGPRHAEKIHETLCSSEEMSKAVDLGDYYRIPADLRDMNYANYMKEDGPVLKSQEYNSSNTEQLDVEGMKRVLLQLEYVKNELK
jgi:UDP-N-acetylglucosamine 4,6-dehydratase